VGYDGFCTGDDGPTDVLNLFECLKRCTDNFTFVAVDCKLSAGRSKTTLVHSKDDGKCKCRIFNLDCVGGNSGQKFEHQGGEVGQGASRSEATASAIF